MENFNNYNMNPFNMGQQPNRWNNMPHYEVIQVNGEAGAKNFRMGPNSSALLLDKTASIIWLAQTDGTGYLTVTPYDFFPHQEAQPVDLNDLANRVSQLEEVINGKSNSYAAKQTRKQPKQPPDTTN